MGNWGRGDVGANSRRRDVRIRYGLEANGGYCRYDGYSSTDNSAECGLFFARWVLEGERRVLVDLKCSTHNLGDGEG